MTVYTLATLPKCLSDSSGPGCMARWRKGSKEAKEALEAIYTLNTHMAKMVRLHSEPAASLASLLARFR